jgi:starvation-inducible outer membrane lipoprotein
VHTINFKNTYTGTLTNEQVMDLTVVRNQKLSLHAMTTDSSGGTLTTFYVFIDPITQAETEVTYDTTTMTANNLFVVVYDYKVPFLRVKYSSGGTSGIIRVTGTTAE